MTTKTKEAHKDFIRNQFDKTLSVIGEFAVEVDQKLDISKGYEKEKELEAFKHGQTHGIASALLFLDRFIDRKNQLDFEAFKREILQDQEDES